ncbi:hypothetical protein BX666DRAFT_1987716 [Dichotomocladium elegans]|nr:hypothetical protein BX666DRAFT_1987716 [Dichotomocladium elegans]
MTVFAAPVCVRACAAVLVDHHPLVSLAIMLYVSHQHVSFLRAGRIHLHPVLCYSSIGMYFESTFSEGSFFVGKYSILRVSQDSSNALRTISTACNCI